MAKRSQTSGGQTAEIIFAYVVIVSGICLSCADALGVCWSPKCTYKDFSKNTMEAQARWRRIEAHSIVFEMCPSILDFGQDETSASLLTDIFSLSAAGPTFSEST